MSIAARLAAVLLFALPGFGAQLYLTIQPVQVCDLIGTSCANSNQELYGDIGNAIWAQANITLNFLPWQTINDTDAYTGTALTDSFQYSNASLVLNPAVDYMYFLPQSTITTAFNCSCILGIGYVNYGLTLIGDSVFAGGYADTLSHELGHNLGLEHIEGSQYLMSPVNSNSSETLANVYPVGTQDQLTSEEITLARQSYLLSSVAPQAEAPEPGTAIVSVGLLLGVLARRRQLI